MRDLLVVASPDTAQFSLAYAYWLCQGRVTYDIQVLSYASLSQPISDWLGSHVDRTPSHCC